QERIKLAGMEDQFGEILVPTEEVVEMRSGQKRKSERKFFPGYVLVQMEMNEGTWHLAKDSARLRGLIAGTAEQPAPLTRPAAASPSPSRCSSRVKWFASLTVPSPISTVL